MTAEAVIDLFAKWRNDPQLAGWVGHYSTRLDGVSRPPFSERNLGFSTGDDRDAVRENRARFASDCDVDLDKIAVPGQCHGREVIALTRADGGEGSLEPSERLRGFDAILLREPDVFALSLSADCPLVLIADPVRRRGGVAHAGWRGTAAGVLEALLEALEGDGSSLSDCYAAVSPGISGSRFQVGPEVFDAVARCPGASGARRGDRLDLRSIHRETLRARGLAPEKISISSDCSFEDQRRFFSHRRDAGQSGRNGALVGWRQEASLIGD